METIVPHIEAGEVGLCRWPLQDLRSIEAGEVGLFRWPLQDLSTIEAGEVGLCRWPLHFMRHKRTEKNSSSAKQS